MPSRQEKGLKMETVNFVMMVVVPAACALVALWCMVWPVREV